ncbi:MAG: transposase [Bacteroidetes bacterium]|nr:transposase [Bacteroidota bacterium]
MLHDKDIKKVSELKNGFTDRWFERDFLLSAIGALRFSRTLKSFNIFKKQGYKFDLILSVLLSLPFMGLKNIHSLMGSQGLPAGKDTFYRQKSNGMIDWRNILWAFAGQFNKIVSKQGDNQGGGYRCLIFDDSLLEKSGRFIEKVSRVWDHVSKRAVLGFKINLMAYWDGTSLLPVDFCLHREKGKNKEKPYGLSKRDYRKQFSKKRTSRMPSYERGKEADQTKIITAIAMFMRAAKMKLRIDYVLMDSWFTCNEFILAVRSVKNQAIHLLGMYKIAKTKFEFRNGLYTYSQVRQMAGKVKRNKQTGYYYQEAVVLLDGMPVKLFFSRKGKNGNWKTFLSTNVELTFAKMLEIYAIRWSVEVFFKESKQLLGLGKDQSTDFDAQIAATTLTLIQHILITLRYRFDRYESKGAMFRHTKAEIIQQRLSERLWGLMLEILAVIAELFDGADEDEIIKKLICNDEAYQKIQKLIGETKMAA